MRYLNSFRSVSTCLIFALAPEIGYVCCGEYFHGLSQRSVQLNVDFAEFMSRYAAPNSQSPLRGHPHLAGDCWMWRRRLEATFYKGRVILCCPEDVQCSAQHSEEILCGRCCFPLCKECLFTSQKKDPTKTGVPCALANDNFWGFAPEIIYKSRVRCIEAAAACPIFTALIT